MPLTAEQAAAVAAVTAAVTNGPREHFLIEAVAGSGKSRTLVEIVRRLVEIRPTAAILCLQFNQVVCARLRQQLADHVRTGSVEVHTMHAFGLRMLGRGELDPDKAYRHWRRLRPSAAGSRDEWFALRHYLDGVRHRGWLPTLSDRALRPHTLEMALLDEMLSDRDTLDQEDGIYHCLYYNAVPARQYDLVLVDEVQDLNDANHAFLRRCVASQHARSVVCAVGDRAQAIYHFRGANPQAMDRFQVAFAARPLALTCCFRCPRRVIAVAQHLNGKIAAAPEAALGIVRIRVMRTGAWPAELVRCAEAADDATMFITRCNATLLEFVRYAYAVGVPRDLAVRWAAPSVAAQLREVLTWPFETLDALRDAASAADVEHAPMDRTLVRLLQTAIALEGGCADVATSPFLRFVQSVLEQPVGPGQLVLATIHGAKGAECEHIVLHQYNLLGNRAPSDQDRNLLYIAVTRALRSLTFILTDSMREVPSPFLPLDLIHCAGSLGGGPHDSRT